MALGYKLDSEKTGRAGPIKFGGVPGLFSQEPTALDDLGGITEKDFDALVKERELPLVKVKNAKSKQAQAEAEEKAQAKTEAASTGAGEEG